MQIPRYSIRVLMVAFTVAALVAMTVGEAVAGWAWTVLITTAIAGAIAVVSVPLVLLVHALFFGVCMAAARRIGQQETVARTSRGGVERSDASPALEPMDVSHAASQPSAPRS